MSSGESTAQLNGLLDAALTREPEYGDGLSNHLPMALHALHALGAGNERLRAFSEVYARRLVEAPASAASAALLHGTWQDSIGRYEAFDSLRRTFESALLDDGIDATLHRVLPALWPGVAGAAFHGLIRTAHAVQTGHLRELAAALAYWAVRWQPVPAANALPDGERLALADWAARLETAALELRLPGRLIVVRIDAAVDTPDYAALADATVLDGLQPVADWAADLYARSGNFTVLHCVTATRAVRVLGPWTSASAEVFQVLLRAVTAAVLASNLQIAQRAGEPLPPWGDLIARAIASDDDHVIKLVHALMEERAVYGDGARQRAAARGVS
ncbi:questin oxidase family protein [soil metagenome]